MFNPKHLHVLIASDSNYAEFVSIVLVSIFENNKSCFEHISIHLFSNGIKIDLLEKINSVIPLDIGKLIVYDIRDISNHLGVNTYGESMPICAYARLLMTEYLDVTISRVLYVDCDVIVTGALNKIWDLDLKKVWVAGSLDAHMDSKPKYMIGMKQDSPYLNSGVLLVNLDAWREVNIVEQFRDFIKKYNGNVYHQDQGVINGVCDEHIMVLSPEYNMVSYFFSHSYSLLEKKNTPFYSKFELYLAKNEPIILHFTEGFLGRPWIKNCRHPFAQKFLEYRNLTPWKNHPLREDSRSLPLKISSWLFLNFPYFVYQSFMFCVLFIKKVIEKCR